MSNEDKFWLNVIVITVLGALAGIVAGLAFRP